MKHPLEWDFKDKLNEGFDRAYRTVSKPLHLDIQFFAVEPELYSFGLADITIDLDGTPLVFDGKDYLQADGGELSLVPEFREISFKDTGSTVVQRRLAGWAGTVTFVVGQEDHRLMKLALSAVDEITDTATTTAVGVTDQRIGTVLQGYRVTIHPRVLPSTDKRFDYTIYQMASTGGITKPYNDEQTTVTITLNMMPRVGMDASKGSNFFYTGPVDPNEA